MASAVDLTMRNTRRYGGYIVHMGMVFVFIGLAARPSIAIFRKTCDKAILCKSGLTLCSARLRHQPERYTAQRLLVEVLQDNKPTMMLYPEKRRFSTTEENGTMVAIYSTLKEDLYVVYAGTSPDTQLP